MRDSKILINEIGFFTEKSKKAVFRGNKITDFEICTPDGVKVYTGSNIKAGHSYIAEEEVFILDFSDFCEEGKYFLKAGDEKSVEFVIGNDIYEDSLKKLFRFFYLQRCGMKLDEKYAGAFAHDICHEKPARIYKTDTFLEVSGGWHDAGDYGRYIVPAAVTLADLFWAIWNKPEILNMKLDIPESNSDLPDVLEEIKYEIDWMLKMQDDKTGGVYHKVTCAKFCDFFMPDKEKEELIICPITYTATADFAASLAMASTVFKAYDEEYSKKLKEASVKAYDALKNISTPGGFRNPEGIGTGEYYDPVDKDEFYWASAELYKAFGEKRFRDDFEKTFTEVYEGYGWEDVGSFGNIAYLSTDFETDKDICAKIKKTMTESADRLLKISDKEGYGISFGVNDFVWGSNMYVAENAIMLLDGFSFTGSDKYFKSAEEHVDYLFGKNPCNICYITGVGTNRIKNPHHRNSAAAGFAMEGMLSGGPNSGLMDPTVEAQCNGMAPAKCFSDELLSYSTNETAIYWNSTLILLLAEIL